MSTAQAAHEHRGLSEMYGVGWRHSMAGRRVDDGSRMGMPMPVPHHLNIRSRPQAAISDKIRHHWAAIAHVAADEEDSESPITFRRSCTGPGAQLPGA